jgi:hypothetical protein
MQNKFQMDASYVCNKVPAADIGVPTYTAQLLTNEIIWSNEIPT